MDYKNQDKILEFRRAYDDKRISYSEYASKFIEIRCRKYNDWRDFPAKDL